MGKELSINKKLSLMLDKLPKEFKKNINKAGPKNFYTLDGRNIGKMWNNVRSGIANIYQEGQDSTLWK